MVLPLLEGQERQKLLPYFDMVVESIAGGVMIAVAVSLQLYEFVTIQYSVVVAPVFERFPIVVEKLVGDTILPGPLPMTHVPVEGDGLVDVRLAMYPPEFAQFKSVADPAVVCCAVTFHFNRITTLHPEVHVLVARTSTES
jgi:hypothetical protein